MYYEKENDFNRLALLYGIAGMIISPIFCFLIYKTAVPVIYFQIGLSYDINISSLKTASESRGGFELTLQYVFAKDPSKNAVPKCYNKF